MKEAVHTYLKLTQHNLTDKLSLNLDQLDLMKTWLKIFQKKRSTDILSEQHKQLQHLNDEAQIIKWKKAQPFDSQQSSTSPSDKKSD